MFFLISLCLFFFFSSLLFCFLLLPHPPLHFFFIFFHYFAWDFSTFFPCIFLMFFLKNVLPSIPFFFFFFYHKCIFSVLTPSEKVRNLFFTFIAKSCCEDLFSAKTSCATEQGRLSTRHLAKLRRANSSSVLSCDNDILSHISTSDVRLEAFRGGLNGKWSYSFFQCLPMCLAMNRQASSTFTEMKKKICLNG